MLGIVEVEFSAEVIEWREPAPYYFLAVPAEECAALEEWSFLSYGWGMLPVSAQVGETSWRTTLMPRNGGYLLPIKDAVREAEQIDDDDMVHARLTIGAS